MPEARPSSFRGRWRRVSVAWYTNLFGREEPPPQPPPPIHGYWPDYIEGGRSKKRRAALDYYTELIGREAPPPEKPIAPSFPDSLNWPWRHEGHIGTHVAEVHDPPPPGSWPHKVRWPWRHEGHIGQHVAEFQDPPIPASFPARILRLWRHDAVGLNQPLPEPPVITDAPIRPSFPDRIRRIWRHEGHISEHIAEIHNPPIQPSYPDRINRTWRPEAFTGQPLPEPPVIAERPALPEFPASLDWAERRRRLAGSWYTEPIGREGQAPPIHGYFPDRVIRVWRHEGHISAPFPEPPEPIIHGSWPDYLDGGRAQRRRVLTVPYTTAFGREGQDPPIPASFPDRQRPRRYRLPALAYTGAAPLPEPTIQEVISHRFFALDLPIMQAAGSDAAILGSGADIFPISSSGLDRPTIDSSGLDRDKLQGQGEE